MTTSNITQQKYTVTVTEGATTLVTVKAVGPQGPQGALQTGDVGDFTVSVANDGTQSAVINTGAVTSSKILDGTIATGDIADDAITSAKIANAAVTTNEIQNLTIINNDISNSAAIAGTKISPDFGSQNISTSGNITTNGILTIQSIFPRIRLVDDDNNSDYDIRNANGAFTITDETNTQRRFLLNSTGGFQFGNGSAASDVDITGNLTIAGTVGGVDLSTYQADGGSYLRSDADDSFTGTLTAQSDSTNPVIQINGPGPNFIRFASDASGTVDADSIDLIYRTTPNTLAFERASDSQIMFSIDADNQQAIFNGNVDCNSGLDVSGGDITGTLGSGVTGTTQSATDDSTKIATTAFVTTAIGNLINNAPSALDTLKELSDALGADANFSATVTNSLDNKLSLSGGTLTGNVKLNDNVELQFGSSGNTDSFISFDGQHLQIRETSPTGALLLDGHNIFLRNPTQSDEIYLKCNGQSTNRNVELYCQGTQRLETTSTGIDVTGVITGTNHLDLPDDATLKLGDNDEFQIFHRGNDSVSLINEQGGGYLSFGSNGSRIEMYDIANARTMAKFNVGGSCEFKHAADIRLQTTSTGISVTGDLIITADTPKIQLIDNNADDDFQISNFSGNFIIKDITNSVDRFTIASDGTTTVANNLNVGAGIDVTGSITIPDATITNGIPNNAIKIGDATDGDLMIYHDSNNSVIRDAGTGSLIFQSNQIVGYRYGTSEKLFQFDQGGAASLFYGGASTAKLATTASGVTVDGRIGVGTASASFPVHVFNDDTETNNQVRIEQDGTGDAVLGFALTGTRAYSLGIDNSDSDKFKISTATNLHTNTLFTIDGANQRVGINQASPDSALDVSGQIRSFSTTGTTDSGLKVSTANESAHLYLQNANTNANFNISYGGSGGADISITHDGIVKLFNGGGTTAKLETTATGVDVNGRITSTVSAANTLMLNCIANMGTHNDRPFRLRSPATDSSTVPFTIETFNALEVHIDGNKTLNIDSSGQINLHHAGANTPKLKTIADGVKVHGNIGIGTDTPNRSLHIVSNGTSKIALTDSDITAETDSLVGGIDFTTLDTQNAGTSAHIGAYHQDDQGNAYLRFDTGNASNVTERMRITATGDLVSIGDGTFDDIRIGEWSDGTAFAGVFHKNQTGQEYMMISTDGSTFISASGTTSVFIRGGSNSTTNQIEVNPTSGINITAANSVNVDGILDFSGASSSPYILMKAVSQRVKYILWNSINFGIGMTAGVSYGSIGNDQNDNTQFATTFQMNDINDRGWVFLDSSHTLAQGAMSLTTQGKMTVAHSMRLGYGESDTTESGATHALDVNGSISSTSTISATTSAAIGDTNLRKITTSTSAPTSSDGGVGDIWIVYPS